MILEEAERAQKRGAPIYAEVIGAYSCVNTDESNQAASRASNASRESAMNAAIDEAGVSPDKVGFIHLNANGILNQDRAEAGAIRNVFGACRKKPALVATKPLTGYLGFASAATEIAMAAMSLREGRCVPSRVSSKTFLRDEFPFATAAENPSGLDTALVNHFASGLTNHSVLLKRWEAR